MKALGGGSNLFKADVRKYKKMGRFQKKGKKVAEVGFKICNYLKPVFIFFFKNSFRIRKSRSASVGPQKSVRKCRSASAGPQVSVRKCESANVGPQVRVRKSRLTILC